MWIIVGPNNVGAFPYCLSVNQEFVLVCCRGNKEVSNIECCVYAQHSRWKELCCSKPYEIVELSVTCYKTGWLGGYLDTSYKWLFLPSSLDILINSHISSLPLFSASRFV